jgi:hypothetical protein
MLLSFEQLKATESIITCAIIIFLMSNFMSIIEVKMLV